jgi:cytochrome c peroxidase
VRAAALTASGLLAGLLAGAALPVVAAEPDHAEHRQPVVLAPGYADLEFDPPEPGTYRLPPLWDAADGAVLTSAGEAAGLHALYGDRVVILSFIYTRCPDVNGCPLATHVFSRIADRLSGSPELAAKVRLITLSFDPANDDAAVMEAYGKRFRREGVDWRFLTTSSEEALEPILDSYDQWVIRDYDEQGKPLGTMSHLLRVYLIDQARQIRNIYSVSFLHADTVAADIETVLMEASGG